MPVAPPPIWDNQLCLSRHWQMSPEGPSHPSSESLEKREMWSGWFLSLGGEIWGNCFHWLVLCYWMHNLRSASSKVENKMHIQCFIAFSLWNQRPSSTHLCSLPPSLDYQEIVRPFMDVTSWRVVRAQSVWVGYLSLLQLFAFREKRWLEQSTLLKGQQNGTVFVQRP